MPRYIRHRRYIRHKRHDRHVPLATIKTVGKLQYSADGSTGWQDSIPSGTMKVATDLSFYVRLDPDSIDEPDNGTYTYEFAMASVGAGGMSLINTGVNLAHISGQTPADQVGKTFQVNGGVKDARGTFVAGTSLTQVWVA